MLVSSHQFINTEPGNPDFWYFEKVADFLNLNDQETFEQNEYLLSCHVLIQDNIPLGRFAIYKNDQLNYLNKRAICIGSYLCVDDDFVANALLNYAQEICLELNYDFMIGPMNGSTWNNYRFGHNESKGTFFLDVKNPAYFNDQFQKFGFQRIGTYCSNVDDKLYYDQSRLEGLASYYESKGANIRSIDMSKYEEELKRIAIFSNLSFSDNFLFTPISTNVFVKQYLKLEKLIDPKFVWIVEDEKEEIHAIFFAIKDYLDEDGKTLIVKTVATRKKSPFKGIATFLSRKLTKIALDSGYNKIIHALMIEDNLSLNASSKHGSPLKEYSLYALALSHK